MALEGPVLPTPELSSNAVVLTHSASSLPGTRANSQRRCHSPGRRPPAAAPAWPTLLGLHGVQAFREPGVRAIDSPGRRPQSAGRGLGRQRRLRASGRDWLRGGAAEGADQWGGVDRGVGGAPGGMLLPGKGYRMRLPGKGRWTTPGAGCTLRAWEARGLDVGPAAVWAWIRAFWGADAGGRRCWVWRAGPHPCR